MNSVIIHAINNCELLSFTYDGYARIVEPHAYGVTTAGKEILRAYQIEGGHASNHNQPWHLFSVSKVVGLSSTRRGFSGVMGTNVMIRQCSQFMLSSNHKTLTKRLFS